MTKVAGKPKRINTPGCPNIVSTPTVGQEVILPVDGPLPPRDRPSSWPFKREKHSILVCWRTLPAHSFHNADHEHVLTTLRQVSGLHCDEELAAALRGEADAAIGAALATSILSRSP